MSEGRDGRGRFAHGNPGGASRAGSRNHRTLAGLERLQAIYDSLNVPQKLADLAESKDERIRFDTLKFIHEQLYGRAPQSLSLTGADGSDLEIRLRVERRDVARDDAPPPPRGDKAPDVP